MQKNRKMTATTHYLEPPSNRIRSRNDNMAKPNQLSWLVINLPLHNGWTPKPLSVQAPMAQEKSQGPNGFGNLFALLFVNSFSHENFSAA
jgi:hypothetical protein